MSRGDQDADEDQSGGDQRETEDAIKRALYLLPRRKRIGHYPQHIRTS